LYRRGRSTAFVAIPPWTRTEATRKEKDCYSRSRNNLARQLSHHSYKSAFTGSQRAICESGATVGVRGFSENGCASDLYRRPTFYPHLIPTPVLLTLSYSRHVRAIPWPSGRWRARRRIDTRHAGRLHSRERAREHVQPRCRGGDNVGRGKGFRRRHRRGRRPAGVARRPMEGPSLRRTAYLRMASGAANTAHERAGGTDCRATGRL